MHTARHIYEGSNGHDTSAYFAQLRRAGLAGLLALHLFRASKTSTRAKRVRGGPDYGALRYRDLAYRAKNLALQDLVALLEAHPLFPYGWGTDPSFGLSRSVLYVDLPQGQVSFHTTMRLSSVKYPGTWDRTYDSTPRILAFCDAVLADLATGQNHQLALIGV